VPMPRGRDLEATRAALAPWIRARYPEAAKVELSALTGPSDTGFSSDTLLFEVRLQEAGRERVEALVARMEPQGFTVFPQYDLEAQYRILEALGARTDVPVPKVRWLEKDATVLGAPFYVMDRVEGRVPTDTPPMHVGGWVPELPEAERAALWWSGIEALCRIHTVDPHALGLGFLDDPERGPDGVAQEIETYERMIVWGLEDPGRYPGIRRAMDWLKQNQPADPETGLCWGDSRLANMIFRGTECVAVLDWEMARLGDPLLDLAWWITSDRCFSEGIGAPRLPGLPSHEETVAHWCERTGRSAEHLGFFQVLALARFAVIMARIGLQMKHDGVLPQDSEMDVDNLASLTLARVLEEVAG